MGESQKGEERIAGLLHGKIRDDSRADFFNTE
jgi:hypothetical protein